MKRLLEWLYMKTLTREELVGYFHWKLKLPCENCRHFLNEKLDDTPKRLTP